MLKKIEKIRIGNNPVSKEIYRYYQRKYCLGCVGLISAITVASLTVDKIKPLSIMIISPSGQLKSTLMNSLADVFPENIVKIPSRFTPYGLSEKFGSQKLNNKTWIVNDMVRTFDGLSQVKISELVGWLGEMISEHEAGSSTAKDTQLMAKMNLIGNIALVSYKELARKFISSTLSERMLQFGYFQDVDIIRKKSDRNYKPNPKKLKIILKPSKITVTKQQQKEIYSLSDKLKYIADYEKYSLRPDEIILAFLAGHAKLNKRNRINKSDFNMFIQMIEHLKKIL